MNKGTILQLLEEHYAKYHQIQMQDLVKLLYQMEFGPGHMIEQEEKSLENLRNEWKQIEKTTSSNKTSVMAEEIGNGMVRVFLNSLEESILPILNKLFVNTANQIKGNRESFCNALLVLREFSQKHYSQEEVNTYLNIYEREGYPAKGHSQTYRLVYAPSYRVILKSYVSFLELIPKIKNLLQNKESLTIAIDGKCACGKTELSSILSAYYDCNVIHMDDFFLPPELRTAERLDEPGGNIHYERFKEEIIENYKAKCPLSYRRFSCKTMDCQERITLPKKQLTIVEGSYSMREDFREIYDYTIFMNCKEETQIERIRRRNGEEMLVMFVEKWIPMENKYFENGNIKELCNEIIYT